MKIVCPNCSNSYDVSAASLGAEGRSVRCVRCKQVWFATPEPEPSAEVGATDAETVSAAASAYQRGAVPPPAVDPDEAAASADEAGDDDASSFDIDPNLAARAADRTGRPSDIMDQAAGWDMALDTHDAPSIAPDGGGTIPMHGPLLGSLLGRLQGRADGQVDRRVDGPREDIESVAARRARRPGKHGGGAPRRRSLAILIAPLMLINGALVLWRSDVVRAMPQTAPLFSVIGLGVNLRGIALSEVTSSRETNENTPILVVQGTITNVSRQQLDIPRLRLALRNAGGTEIYTWTALPERQILAPGESEPFQTRLASPPADTRDVVVRFFHRRDVTSGMR